MPRRPLTPRTTATGRPVGNAPHRVAFATEQLMRSGYSTTRKEIMRRFSVSHATAELDIARAYLQIANDAERERPFLRTRETARMHRIASAAESGRDFHAAISASARLAKINALDTVDVMTAIPVDEMSMLRAIQLDPSTMTRAEARAHVHVLSLTPAQRLAEDDRLAGEQAALLDDIDTMKEECE